MHRSLRAVAMVVGGVVGGWLGYWVGHALGLSQQAQWPWRIGAGGGAIAISIAASVLGVLVVGAAFALPPFLRERRLARVGRRVPVTILDGWSLGMSVTTAHSPEHLYAFLAEMRQPDGAVRIVHATQWLTSAEFAALASGHAAVAMVDSDDPGRVVLDVGPVGGARA